MLLALLDYAQKYGLSNAAMFYLFPMIGLFIGGCFFFGVKFKRDDKEPIWLKSDEDEYQRKIRLMTTRNKRAMKWDREPISFHELQKRNQDERINIPDYKATILDDHPNFITETRAYILFQRRGITAEDLITVPEENQSDTPHGDK